jgi:pimeloyl-ACP methyl ester carboxylesterase
MHPTRLGLVCQDVELTSEDGKKISAWWLPQGREGKAPLLILHGLGASKAHMMDYILFAQKEGYPVMAIDFRGHGESEASLTSIGFHESRDVEAGMRYIRGTGSGDPVLWGTSMGAVSALLAAERDGSVSGVIADAPFDTYRNTICHHAKLMYGIPEFPLIVLACPMIEERAHFRMDDVNSLRAAAKIHAPMLVLAGEKDVRMDSAVVRTVYEAAGGPKEFWVIPGEGHENRTFQDSFQEKIRTFLARIRSSRKS